MKKWMVVLFFSVSVPVEAVHITPGELLIRLTPEAAADSQRLQADAPIAVLHATLMVESLRPLFTYLARPALQLNLTRTYLLRFSPDVPLKTIKAAYAESPLIEAVEFNYLRSTFASNEVPNDPRYPEQWNLPLMKLPQAWAIEKGDKRVIIAIIDSGIDYTHPDLAPKTWVNPHEIPHNGLDDDRNGYVDDIHGWDFTDAPTLQAEGDFTEGDNEPIDESGHGTHVAGIAGAMVGNGIGIAGVAWHCPLMPIRAGLSLGGSARMQDDDSAAAIVYAVDNGASIINMSWGSEQSSFIIQDAIDYAHARGAVLVAAAGNSQKAAAIFPAAYTKVIAVASTEQNQLRFYQSNFGATVDIAAPGNVILSTQIQNRYRLLTGTSMAAPHVAGVAALIRSKRPALTHEEIRQILINTADPVLKEDSDELDVKFVGAGTVNAERALLASSALQARILAPETNQGGSDRIVIVGTAGGYKFEKWQLSYGASTVPSLFTPFTSSESEQKIAEQLTIWETAAVPEGVYTVRLTVTATDGRQTHDQVVLTVDRTPPRVTALTATETFYGNGAIAVFTWATDDVTRNTLYYRRKSQLAPFARIEGSELGTSHVLSAELAAGTYQFFVLSQNTVGLQTTEDNGGTYYPLEIKPSFFSANGFDAEPLSMNQSINGSDEIYTGIHNASAFNGLQSTKKQNTSLHLANVTADFDGDGLPEIVGKPIHDAPHPLLSLYERLPTGTYQLVQHLSIVDSTTHLNQLDAATFTPWDVSDTDNDGLLEILASDDNRTFLLEQIKELETFKMQEIWETPFLSGGIITDLDGDGLAEIVGADNNNDRLLIFENRGNNQYEETVSLHNETEGSNVFGHHFAIDDFNADGKLELVAGDSEGELFIYTASANDNVHLQWQTRLKITELTQFAAGDLTGDGKPEFVVGGTLVPESLPAAFPLWKFIVWTHTAHGYVPLWEHAIAPYRRSANSVRIADVDGDTQTELILLAHPNLYVMKWNGTTFQPLWHREVSETPALFTADLNQNGFDELYLNINDALHRIESTFARDKDSPAPLTPWNVSATPLTAKAVQVTWTVPPLENASDWRVYRAHGQKSTAPPDTEFETVAQNLTVNRFLDRSVATDTTYWYAITAIDSTGRETARTEPVYATPRKPPKLIRAVYDTQTLNPEIYKNINGSHRIYTGINKTSGVNGTEIYKNMKIWVIVTFNRQMGDSISDSSKYLLRLPQRIEGTRPLSVIRDRMGTRARLAFDAANLFRLHSQPNIENAITDRHITHSIYEITVSNVRDIDNNLLRAAAQTLQIPFNIANPTLTDFTRIRVYPNPVYPNLSDRGTITFDGVPVGTRIQIFNVNAHLLEEMNVTESDNHRKQWHLTSNRTADIATGIYIYVLEFKNEKKIGKIAIIK